jgi:hypothetical protein
MVMKTQKGEKRMIENCEGYKTLLAAVEKDEKASPGFHDYRGKMQWTLDRAKHYAEKTGIDAARILDSWEEKRNYWYMNFYQEANQPKLDGQRVKVFDNQESALESIGTARFRCPKCELVSKDAYECSQDECDWKVYGLFTDLGKGVYVFLKDQAVGQRIFMPIAWESEIQSESKQKEI